MLNRAMREIGDDKLIRILGIDQYRQLQNLSRAALDATYQPAYTAVNHSNTAPMLLSLLRGARAVPGVPLIVTDNAEKMAARAGYANQLREALAARARGELPQIPPSAQNMAQSLAAMSTPSVNAALNQRRKAPNREARNGN
jgi:hypothetical protein